MAILKQIIAFIRAKMGTFMTKNLSVEDQYIQAADSIIDEVHKLKTRHVTAGTDIRKFTDKANEKIAAAESIEKDIRFTLQQDPNADVTSKARLGILNRRMAEAFQNKVQELISMKSEIERTTVELDDVRKDLQAKLEVCRAQREAAAMGLGTSEDVAESAALVKIDVESHITRIKTFNAEPAVSATTNADIDEYLANLRG